MIDGQKSNTVQLHNDDNVLVTLGSLSAGDIASSGPAGTELSDAVPMGHKVACQPIATGQLVLKYGQPIGTASEDIAVGQWVHTHNLVTTARSESYQKATDIPSPPAPITDRTFLGYRREDGKAGTRNYIAVISNVNCSASVASYIAKRFDPQALADYPNVDGVVAFTHGWGCGMKYDGQIHQMLARVLGGIAKHPNIGGYLIVGLGCEQSTIGYLLDKHQLVQIRGNETTPSGPPVLSMQDMGGTLKTVEAGIEKLAELLPRANDVERIEIPASEIVLGTECGGSDGNSGITANPALGVASDLLVACGGTSILAETPEIYGAEHLLTRRSRSVEVADKLLDKLKWWEWYAGLFGEVMDSNPTVGNKEGGLTTIVEKSLGAVAKGGSTALMDVYDYAEPVTSTGFVVMDTPGFDPPSVTGMVAGGANVVVFTTGRGSCFGCKPTPSIKVASNSPMYERMVDDMDINAGQVLEGKTVQQMGQEIFDEILAVASGKQTKSEIHGIGDEEFVPWAVGAQL
jgi:altronate dehydratase